MHACQHVAGLRGQHDVQLVGLVHVSVGGFGVDGWMGRTVRHHLSILVELLVAGIIAVPASACIHAPVSVSPWHPDLLLCMQVLPGTVWVGLGHPPCTSDAVGLRAGGHPAARVPAI
jgi:hypothetical protein